MSQRLERLVNLLAALIDTKRPLTREDIYKRVPGYSGSEEAKRRSFERDKETLRQMSVPIKTEPVDPAYPDHGDGYLVAPDDYYLPDPGLTRDELSALALAASSVKWSSSDAASALWKLGAENDTRINSELLGSSNIELDDSEALGIIFEARRSRQQITFNYKGNSRNIDPYRITSRNGRWYVSGLDHQHNDMRTFRIDRIVGRIETSSANAFEAPTPTSSPWTAPWEMGDEQPIEAIVKVDSSQASLALNVANEQHVSRRFDDGSIELTLRVTNRAALMSFVLGFLDHAELVAPLELRSELVNKIRHLEHISDVSINQETRGRTTSETTSETGVNQ